MSTRVPPRDGSLRDRLRRGFGALADAVGAGRLAGSSPGPDHVALGGHCHATQLLKTLGLRTWSGPFDWLFSAPGMVSDCLEDDFATFLDRRHLESVPLHERHGPDITRCRHLVYGPRYGLPFIFNHHDPAACEDDYARLERSVARLRRALADPAGHRFYLLAITPTGSDAIVRLCDNLARHRPAHHLTLIQVAPERGEPRAAARSVVRPNLTVHDVVTRTPSLGLRFGDPADDALVLDLLRRGLPSRDHRGRAAEPGPASSAVRLR